MCSIAYQDRPQGDLRLDVMKNYPQYLNKIVTRKRFDNTFHDYSWTLLQTLLQPPNWCKTDCPYFDE
jgi:hypothetical protein